MPYMDASMNNRFQSGRLWAERMAATWSVLALSLCFLVSVKSVSGQGCAVYTQCSDCISSPLKCAWCPDEVFDGSRCYGENEASNCNSQQSPQPNANTIRNESLGSENIQIQPQRIEANLRAGDPMTLNFRVSLGRNFPLDVYFLMDFSSTMRGELVTLADLANEVSDTVRNITPNFQLGFGSFVEKPTHPFVQTGTESYGTQQNAPPSTNRCVFDGTCVAPYLFRNHLSLTRSTEDFARVVGEAKISTNFDIPEALLDAMVQVLACRRIIGWREPPVRHLLVLLTDAAIHFAGDGKLGAAVERNVGRCLMENNETYNGTDSLLVDYPSIGLVTKLLQQENVVPIYMVTRNDATEEIYNNLVRETGGSVAFLIDGAADLIPAIRDNYANISTEIEFTSNSIAGLDVSIVADCTGATAGAEPNSCSNVAAGVPISFTVTLNVTECTEELRNGVNLTISDRFAGSVVIQVTGLCGCDCERDTELNSPRCNSLGTLVCGVCQCNPGSGRFGERCQCIDEDPSDGIPTTDICPLGDNGEQCSGSDAGSCNCGVCECKPYLNDTNHEVGVYQNGPRGACECNNVDNCEVINGVPCSGRGNCSCSQCECEEGYTGALCQCLVSNDICINPGDNTNEVCSGNGMCDCNVCACNDGFSGRYCERCRSEETCTPEDCQRFNYADCISCIYRIVDSTLQRRSSSECESVCGNITIVEVNGRSAVSGGNQDCLLPLTGDSCILDYYFQYEEDSDQSTLYVVNTPRECFIFPPWAIALILFILLLIAAIVLILLIKLLLYILDRIEYKRFQKEVDSTRFGENVNPLYHQPETQHANPLFAGKAAPPEKVADEDDLPKKML